jgi:hypothetical protein
MRDDQVTVRFEPCEVWTMGADPNSGTCCECGWLEEDHWMAELERGWGGRQEQPVSV